MELYDDEEAAREVMRLGSGGHLGVPAAADV
jgi:hypothetical protein